MKRRKQGSLEEKSQIGDSTAHVNVYWNVSHGSSLKNQPAGCPKANHNMVKSILKSHYLTTRKFNAKVLQVFLATGKILNTFQNNPAFIAGFPCLFPLYLCSALQSQKKIYEKRKKIEELFFRKYRITEIILYPLCKMSSWFHSTFSDDVLNLFWFLNFSWRLLIFCKIKVK